ncbi:polysaccharide pyruvyl transferase family protein [Haloprofundus salinisoli]|uniref:polysaccharide pyruvyl transferase family protein n=1 Tax=Haloprofundus salinisoli TaxID=2876193 RepID=UPI001CCFDE81|nr:polysaccharide pyruvyl transferase family protein [Haloprofundus salinisoli]
MTDTYFLINWAGLNVGDDLLSETVIKEVLPEKYELYLASHRLSSHLENTEQILGWMPLFEISSNISELARFIGAIRDSDYVIIAGGDVLRPSFTSVLPLLCSSFLNKPVYILGVGSVGMNSPFWRAVFRCAFSSTEIVYTRDNRSMELISELLPKSTEQIVAPDLIFSYDLDAQNSNSDAIIVNLRYVDEDTYYEMGDELTERLADDLSRLSVEMGYTEIILVPFVDDTAIQVTGFQRASDIPILSDLKERLKERSGVTVTILNRRPNKEEFEKILERGDVSIGMRYHFVITSLLADIPTIAVPYAPKVDQLSTWVPALGKLNYGRDVVNYDDLRLLCEDPNREVTNQVEQCVELTEAALEETKRVISDGSRSERCLKAQVGSLLLILAGTLANMILRYANEN